MTTGVRLIVVGQGYVGLPLAMRAVEASATTLGRHLRPGATVVLESTTYPGTTEGLLAPLLEQALGAGRRHRLPARVQPGADRPRERDRFRFVELANDVNDHMPDYVVRRLTVALNRRPKGCGFRCPSRALPVNGKRILVLGLAYKKNSSDDRESPATVVTDRLLALGADVRAADPHVVEGHVDSRVVRVEATAAEIAAADAVVLLTDHDSFDYEALTAARYVLDTRHRLAAAPNVEHL